MFPVFRWAGQTLSNRRAQLLLPAVLLLPLFVLVIYLLVETTKLSISKVGHQFALDNAAYAQMTSVSAWLNAAAYVSGPLPYRVLDTYRDQPLGKTQKTKDGDLTEAQRPYQNQPITVFDLFFRAGAVPTLASDYVWGKNNAPRAESTDWGVHFAKYPGIESITDDNGNPMYDRSGWEKENPDEISGPVYLMNKEIVETHYVPADGSASGGIGLSSIKAYLNTYVQLGDIYNLQEDIYKKLIKNAVTFRQGYFLNVDDCKLSSCARQSASQIMKYLTIPTKRQEASDVVMYVSSSRMAGAHGGAVKVDVPVKEWAGSPLFLFASVAPAGRSKLRTLKRGVSLKQNYQLPKTWFDKSVNLQEKYKPYVRNRVIMSCPRNNNNCVWPNPLPKYSVVLRP